MRLIDIDYAAFNSRLSDAVRDGERVEKRDKERWAACVKAHGVREGACLVYAKGLSETLLPVIIDSKDEWSGYYLYSKKDQVCVKFDLGQ